MILPIFQRIGKKICLQAISGNDSAIALYQKMGFQEKG